MFFKFKRINELEKKIYNLTNKVNILNQDIEYLIRTLEHHEHNKITGSSRHCVGNIMNWHDYLYVYKNGEEYKFQDLYIESPVFEQGELDNIVYAISGNGKHKYILDLKKCTYIKYNELDDKEDEKGKTYGN